ncbi:MAG: NAD-dependent epimerase/dehydratase family protein [Marinobacter sp.]|uniref:NAD-dependent epimerase/dehydratase family protein n=1 Tax=Marinobacter sp. TaxID=50741 RepID=UPI0032980A5E
MVDVVQVIGATGFIGGHVYEALCSRSYPVVGVGRKSVEFANVDPSLRFHSDSLKCGDGTDVRIAKNVGTVIFCAGMAHIQNPTPEDLEQFFEANCYLPVRYARAAIRCGARRFIFLSSIGVHGERGNEPFSEGSPYAPSNHYSRSKILAEQKLIKLFEESDCELVIIRPPMVYGPEAPGNFSRVSSLVKMGLPLPFGGLKNQRSFLFVGNLVSFILRCIDHPNAAGQVFVVSDDEDVSTRDFVVKIATAQKLRCILLPLPAWLFKVAMTLVGQGKAAGKLAAPLTVDCCHAKRTLGWTPPYSLAEGIRLSFPD